MTGFDLVPASGQSIANADIGYNTMIATGTVAAIEPVNAFISVDSSDVESADIHDNYFDATSAGSDFQNFPANAQITYQENINIVTGAPLD